MKQVPVLIMRPEALTAEIKCQAANAGLSVLTHEDVPMGQVFVRDPGGALKGRREVYEIHDQVLDQDQQRLASTPVSKLRSARQRLLTRRSR